MYPPSSATCSLDEVASLYWSAALIIIFTFGSTSFAFVAAIDVGYCDG